MLRRVSDRSHSGVTLGRGPSCACPDGMGRNAQDTALRRTYAAVMPFFSARSYSRGSLARSLALGYLCLCALVVVPAWAEAAAPGPSDGSFFFGFAMLVTAPLSLGVMLTYSAIAWLQGVPLSDQDGAWWVIPAFALCALVNAFLVWVVFRGRRTRLVLSGADSQPLG